MGIESASRPEISRAVHGQQNKIMLLTLGRLFYAGLLGRPRKREFGAITIYVSFQNPFRIQIGNGEWKSAHAQVIQQDTPHRISSADRMIGMIMIEPETVDMASLPAFLRPEQAIGNYPQVCEKLRSGLCSLMDGRVRVNDIRNHFDQFFFSQNLPSRMLDPRMAMVVDRIRGEPYGTFSAEALASDIDLSVSRFLHLFSEDVGTTFRQFRAWKRVRGFLTYVNTQLKLTDIAMEAGYPSSSYFSYTVRRYWGLTPKDMVAGSRQLAVIHESDGHAIKGYCQR